MSDVIFTPVFRDTVYLHHLCSECGYKLKVGQKFWGGVNFDDTKEIKFCPSCGTPVVRFSDKAIFETPIDYEPLRIFYDAFREFQDKCKWLYRCYISDEHREKVKELLPFAENEPKWGWTKKAYDVVHPVSVGSVSWQTIRKLERKFGTEREG